MHKYLHHIGDFMRDTVHLSTLEECFYRRALDFYYLNESPLPKETQSVFRRLRATTEEEKQAVLNVLGDFFTEEEDGFHNKRCDAEIQAYKLHADKNRENGKKGGRPPKKKPDENPRSEESGEPKNPEETQPVNLGSEIETQKNLNHKPLTNNHEPITSNQYIYTFDLDYVNANLLKSGRRPVDQKYIDQLQPQFELYYANQPMVDNKALVKFVQWIMRNQDQPQKQQSITKTTAQILAEQRMQLDQQQGQVIDVGEPKKPLLIEEVGRA